MNIKDAVILSAGMGTRLGVLTESMPKPLVSLNGNPMIDYVVKWLLEGGVEYFHVNLHYLGDQIKKHLKERFNGHSLNFYHEAQILGTGGSIIPMLPALQSPFIVVNADAIILQRLTSILKLFDECSQQTPFLLVDSNPESAGFGRMKIHDGKIYQILDSSIALKQDLIPVAFCGFSILSDELWLANHNKNTEIPQMLVKDVFIPWLEAGNNIYCRSTSHHRFDLGTPSRLKDAEKYLKNHTKDT